MTRKRLSAAYAAAKRFLAAADVVSGKVPTWDVQDKPEWSDQYMSPSKYVAACKRASLDLTRALSDLRRSDYQ